MIYLVTGFMRSGTSAFMQSIEKGGLPIIASKERDDFNILFSDGEYIPNPVGLYEPNISDIQNKQFLLDNDGMALKVVAPLVHCLPVHEYNIVFIHRDEEEIRQSLSAAFHIKYTADNLLYDLGYTTLFNVTNPFDFMDNINLSGKSNFFEQRVTEYQRAYSVTDSSKRTFDLNGDF